jgi:phosphohistidine phosphatase
MKTLYLLRHAKSSWDNTGLTDFERPLSSRGEKAAPFMGEVMRKYEFLPELIISSPAERAKQTASLAKESGQFEGELRFDERIYGAGSSTLLDIISSVDDIFRSLMLVGHNPTFEHMTGVLTGEFKRTPTAALAVIDLNIESWSKVQPDIGTLRKFIRPKDEMENF